MKKRIILTSVLSIAMCLSLIVGATMAFFGSESKANISVTGANVNVVASIDPATGFTTYSNGKTSEELGYPNGVFENGGTASIDAEGMLVLNAISAGDSVKVRVDIYNDSNIRIQYRARVVCEEGEEFLDLFEIENDIRHMAWQIAEIGNELKDEIVEVTIGLPENVNLEDFEGQTIKFAIVVEAVQANAETTDEVIVYEPEEGNTAADNGADLQNIMASGLEAGASVYLGAGEYAIESALTIPDGVSLYGVQRGNAAETWANDENAEKTIITLTQDSDEVLTVTNSGTIIDGIMVNGGTEFYTKGIFVQGSETLTGIEIRNSAVVECANDGISVQNTDGAVIENCYVDTVYDCGIVLENYSNSDGVTAYIRDNVVKNVGRLWTANGSQNGAIAVRGNDDFGCKGDVVVSGNTVENVLSTANDLGTSAIVVEKIHGGGVVTIEDNTVKNVSQGISVYKFCSVADADKVVISGNAIENADNFGIATGTLNFYETPVIDTVEITGNTFTGKVPANGNVYLEQTNRYNETTVDWLVIVNGVEFTDETVDANLSLISTAAELSALAGKVNAGDAYSGKTVALVSDIDLSEVEWAPMGYYSYDDASLNKPFSGKFDGNGFTITVKLDNTEAEAAHFGGVFVYLLDAEVQNLTVDGDIATGGWAGILAGRADNSIITSVTTTGTIVGNGEDASVAGLCEYLFQSEVTGCVNSADVTSKNVTIGYQYAGGIACEVNASEINGCENYGNITATPGENTASYIGGIAAYIKNGSTLEDNKNYGNITVTSGIYCEVGGIVGEVWLESAGEQKVIGNENYGEVTVTANDTYAGGIAGTAYTVAEDFSTSQVTMTGNTNEGAITMTPADTDVNEGGNIPAAGGIIGWATSWGGSFVQEGNTSTGTVTNNSTRGQKDDIIGMLESGDYSIDVSGKTPEENGAALEQLLMNAQDGDVITLAPATYKPAHSLVIAKSVTIYGQGTVVDLSSVQAPDGATYETSASLLIYSNSVTIENVTFVGNPNLTNVVTIGSETYSGDNQTIKFGDEVYYSFGKNKGEFAEEWYLCENIRLINCTFKLNEKPATLERGLFLHGRYIIVSGCTFENLPASDTVIKIEEDHTKVLHCTFTNCSDVEIKEYSCCYDPGAEAVYGDNGDGCEYSCKNKEHPFLCEEGWNGLTGADREAHLAWAAAYGWTHASEL